MQRLTHWKRPWCWEGLKVGGEGGNRAWNGWMASLTQWTWVWASSGSWWCTGRPGVRQSMELQRVGHNWATELNWTDPLRETLVVQVAYINYLVSMKYFRDEKTEIQESQTSSPRSRNSLLTEPWRETGAVLRVRAISTWRYCPASL